MSNDFAAELDLAVRAVRAASLVCRRVQENLTSAGALEKADRSPVTVADFASQAVVCAQLAEHSQIKAVVGEEAAAELRAAPQSPVAAKVMELVRSARGGTDAQILDWIDLGGAEPTDRYWTLDPIDGTKGFLRGEQYAVALALIVDGQVELGVLGCPRLDGGILLTATRGKGAFTTPLFEDGASHPIAVSPIATAYAARFCESVDGSHSDHALAALIAAKLGITSEPLRLDSQAKYACVARGDASIYLRLPTRQDYREKIWDHAAGLLVVEEAGGQVTDVHGAALDFSCGRQLEKNAGVIATNRRIHGEVVAAVGEVLAL